MDFRNAYILHLIDQARRFSVAGIIHSKCKEVIIDKIFKKWLFLEHQIFFLSDTGIEINNNVLKK